MTRQHIKDVVLSKIQEKLGEKMTVQDDLDNAFRDWFQNLVQGGMAVRQAAAAPQEGEEVAA